MSRILNLQEEVKRNLDKLGFFFGLAIEVMLKTFYFNFR